MTETIMLAHVGSPITWKRPNPCASATSARPTAVTGERMRTSTTSTATTPRLFGQRQLRAIACGRRGVRTSHTAITANTPAKAARRTNGSYENRASRIGWKLDSLLGLLLFNHSLE